jgi:poly(A) polymerase
MENKEALKNIAEELKDLIAVFQANNKTLYLVGGTVRALFFPGPGEKTSISDIDLATDATPEEIKDLVKNFADAMWLTGEKFGTIGFSKNGRRFEVTTFRSESYFPSSRKPMVSYSTKIEQDLARRDFTFNAMAILLPQGNLIDPFGGLNDLKAGVLRTPLTPEVSFSDDPLRMLRAARFINYLNVTADDTIVQAARKLKERLKIVSVERIRDEFSKIVLAPDPSKGLWFLIETGLFDQFMPEIPALKLEQDPLHRHKDVLVHTIEVTRKTNQDLVLRLAALLHDIGKPSTKKITDQGVTFHGHDIVGAKLAKKRLKALKYPNNVIEDVFLLIKLHLRVHSYKNGWTDRAVRRYVRDADYLLDKLNALIRADCTTANQIKAQELQSRMNELEGRIAYLRQQEELESIRPEIDGHRVMELLNLKPGKEVGLAMQWLMELRLDEGILGKQEVEKRLLKWWNSRNTSLGNDASNN